MQNLVKQSLFTLLVSFLIFSCSKQEIESINSPDKATGNSKALAETSKIIGAYQISDFAVDAAGTTWTFTVQRVGEAQGNGLSHLVLGFNYCEAFTPTGDITITSNQPGTTLAFSEGGGTGCEITGVPYFFKFDGIDGMYSDGEPHTFTFTTSEPLKIENFSVWVKYGNNCATDLVGGVSCDPPVVDPSCSLSQGFWFEKPGSWASKGYTGTTITIGKYTYTEAEAMAIRNSSNKGGMLDAKMAFLQAATIYLSDATNNSITDEAAVWPLYNGAVAFLNSLNKLATTTNNRITVSIPTTPDPNAYGGAIGNWIDSNHCEVEPLPTY